MEVLEASLAVHSVRIPRFAEITGYTAKAVERKIESGKWLEGFEWVKSPDGERLIYLPGYERWVRGLPREHVANGT